MREIVFDLETTGLDPKSGHRIVEIGCVELLNRTPTGKVYHTYVNPERDVPEGAKRVHGLSTEFLLDKPVFSNVVDEFLAFVKNDPLVIHNAAFDMGFINYQLRMLKKPLFFDERAIDTLWLARKKFPGAKASLDALCQRFGIALDKRDKHGALLDAQLLAEVYIHLTGGYQNALNLEEANGNKSGTEIITQSVINKTTRKTREFLPSKEEIDTHAAFIRELKKLAG